MRYKLQNEWEAFLKKPLPEVKPKKKMIPLTTKAIFELKEKKQMPFLKKRWCDRCNKLFETYSKTGDTCDKCKAKRPYGPRRKKK